MLVLSAAWNFVLGASINATTHLWPGGTAGRVESHPVTLTRRGVDVHGRLFAMEEGSAQAEPAHTVGRDHKGRTAVSVYEEEAVVAPGRGRTPTTQYLPEDVDGRAATPVIGYSPHVAADHGPPIAGALIVQNASKHGTGVQRISVDEVAAGFGSSQHSTVASSDLLGGNLVAETAVESVGEIHQRSSSKSDSEIQRVDNYKGHGSDTQTQVLVTDTGQGRAPLVASVVMAQPSSGVGVSELQSTEIRRHANRHSPTQVPMQLMRAVGRQGNVLMERSATQAAQFGWVLVSPFSAAPEDRDGIVVQLCLLFTLCSAFVAGCMGACCSVRTLCTWLLPAAADGKWTYTVWLGFLEMIGFHSCLVDTLNQMHWPMHVFRVLWTFGRIAFLILVFHHGSGLWPALAVLATIAAFVRACAAFLMTSEQTTELWEEEPVLRAMYGALKSPVVEAVSFQHALEEVLVAPYRWPAVVLAVVGKLIGVASLMIVLLFPAQSIVLSVVWWWLLNIEMWFLLSPLVCAILNAVHWMTAAVAFRDQFPHRHVCDENPARVWPVLRRGLFGYFVQRSRNALRAAEITVGMALAVAVVVAIHIQVVVEELWRFATGPQRFTVVLGLAGSSAVVAGTVLLLTAFYIGIAALVNYVLQTHWQEFTNYCKRCSPKRLLDDGFAQQLASVKVLQQHDCKVCLFSVAPSLGPIAISGGISVLVTGLVLLYRTVQDNT